jgi:hypothetical protein
MDDSHRGDVSLAAADPDPAVPCFDADVTAVLSLNMLRTVANQW